MHPMLNIATKAAREASKPIIQALNNIDLIKTKTVEKSPNNPVTEIDRKAEQIIIDNILSIYPEHTILAEESGQVDNDQEYTWIIDPLDGTKNFIHGFPHFCISIAVKHKHRIEHGLIYDPIRDELFTASRGSGAQINGRRMRVSQHPGLKNALLGTGFPFRPDQSIENYISSFTCFSKACGGIRRAGAAALDIAYVAAGRLDGFWEDGLQIWDFAAGALMVKEAGGRISDFNGTDDYSKNGQILAGTPKVFNAMLKELHDPGK